MNRTLLAAVIAGVLPLRTKLNDLLEQLHGDAVGCAQVQVVAQVGLDHVRVLHIVLVEPDHTEHTNGELLAACNSVVHGLRALGVQHIGPTRYCCATGNGASRSNGHASAIEHRERAALLPQRLLGFLAPGHVAHGSDEPDGTARTVALMASLGIGLKVATLPVIALGVGVGVDYGIYLFERIQHHMRDEGVSFAAAFENAMRERGSAAVFTAITMAVAVGTWTLSALKFQADMGLLLSFMFLVNMLGAICLLPAMGSWLFRVTSPRAPQPGAAPVAR